MSVSESIVDINKDWLKATEIYFYALPDDLLSKTGLKDNYGWFFVFSDDGSGITKVMLVAANMKPI